MSKKKKLKWRKSEGNWKKKLKKEILFRSTREYENLRNILDFEIEEKLKIKFLKTFMGDRVTKPTLPC